MPTTPTEFTMNADVRAVRPDSADAGADADISAFTSLEIYFDANIKAGEWLIATLTPRPWLLKPERFTGYIRSDGRMWDTKAVSVAPADLTDPGNIGVRMLANGAELNLSTPLSYKVSSNRVVLGNGKKWSVTPYSVPVPSTDTTVELGNLSPVPGTTVVGIPNLGNLDQLNDATAIGKSIVRAVDLAAVWTLLGVMPTANLPDLAKINYLGTVASQAAMLALTGQSGDWCIRSDTGAAFIITGTPTTSLGSWTQLPWPAVPVQSVFGRTGAVTGTKSDVGLGAADNTSDVDKPVSTAQAAADTTVLTTATGRAIAFAVALA